MADLDHVPTRLGLALVFGTDYPAGGPNEDPVTGMFCAIKREFQDGTPFTAGEAVDAQTAIDAYTINPAIELGLDQQLGKLAVGYQADLDLMADDPREAAQRSLATNPPQVVIVAGAVVVP